MPTIYHQSRFEMVGTRSLSSLRERNSARRWARIRATVGFAYEPPTRQPAPVVLWSCWNLIRVAS